MSTERPEIRQDDPKFGSHLVPWYKALVNEFGVASRAAKEAKQPLPTEYSFPVPEDQHGRDSFVVALLDALDRSLANQTAHPMTSEDIRAVRAFASQVVPFKAVESDDFPNLLRLRVNLTHGILKAGLVEVLACILRAQLKRGKAISAAQNLSRGVLAGKGRAEVKDIDPETWKNVMGQRVVNEDEKSKVPAIATENQKLYEKLFMQSGDEARPVLERIVDVFNRKVDPFAKSSFPHDPEYLRVQWFHATLNNLDQLNHRDDVEDLAAALKDIADHLEAAKDKKSFTGVIDTIGLPKKAAN